MMSKPHPKEFDFPGFVSSLENSPPELLGEVEGEIQKVSRDAADDTATNFWQLDYKRKLERLRFFLKTGWLPRNMTPSEEEAYRNLIGTASEVVQVVFQAR